jgi:hypothetical protein
MVRFSQINRLADDENTHDGDPVAFQYPDGVVCASRPLCSSRSARGQKKNHCSLSLTSAMTASAARVVTIRD